MQAECWAGAGVVSQYHELVSQGAITNGFWKTFVNVVYWLLPHRLSQVPGGLVAGGHAIRPHQPRSTYAILGEFGSAIGA